MAGGVGADEVGTGTGVDDVGRGHRWRQGQEPTTEATGFGVAGFDDS